MRVRNTENRGVAVVGCRRSRITYFPSVLVGEVVVGRRLNGLELRLDHIGRNLTCRNSSGQIVASTIDVSLRNDCPATQASVEPGQLVSDGTNTCRCCGLGYSVDFHVSRRGHGNVSVGKLGLRLRHCI